MRHLWHFAAYLGVAAGLVGMWWLVLPCLPVVWLGIRCGGE